LNAALLKRQHDHLLNIGVIVGDQNLGHWNPLEARPNGTAPTPAYTYCSITRSERQRTRSTGVLQLLAGGKLSV
jgi:hypothetical protein